MSRARLISFFATGLLILATAFGLIKYASGYRPDFTNGRILPTGLLVAVSYPDGAQLLLHGALKSATNTTLSLAPGKYDVAIKKDGFTSWEKTVKIEKELVTKADAYLFSQFPDFKNLTFTGASDLLPSPDNQKVAFTVSTQPGTSKDGLWVLDLSDALPGLSREPRQIVQGSKSRDFAKSKYAWSPDSKQILVKLRKEAFVLETDRLNPAANLVDISQNLTATEDRWQKEADLRHQAQLAKLPPELASLAEIQFSPDESKILYTATEAAVAKLRVYDLKEKEDFYVMDKPGSKSDVRVTWFPTSKHLFIVRKDKISTVETDGQNLVDLWAGSFADALPFPSSSGNKILILTSIGKDTLPNLYAVSLR